MSHKISFEFSLPYEITAEEMRDLLVNHYKIDPTTILSVSVNNNQTIYNIDTLWSKEYILELYHQYFHYMCDGFDTDKYNTGHIDDPTYDQLAQSLEHVSYDGENILEWMH